MRSLCFIAAALGLLARDSMAATCTSSNATPIEQFFGTGGGGGGGGGGGSHPEIDAITASFRNIMTILKRDAATAVPAPAPTPAAPDARLSNVAYLLTSRADAVECSATEMCLSIQAVPFCLDLLTYAFHTGDGTTGNALTGEYTLPDGTRGNMYTEGAAASSPDSAQTTTAATTPTAATGGEAGGTSARSLATQTGAASAPTSTNAAVVGGRGAMPVVGGAVIGLLGVGLM